MGLTFRSIKGSPLTHEELDTNFTEFFYSASYSPTELKLFRSKSNGSISLPVAAPPGRDYHIIYKTGNEPSGANAQFTSSGDLRYDYRTATLKVTGSQNITGNLVVGGNIVAEEFITERVSTTYIYKSGSTKFGDSQEDNHAFTGSINLQGSSTISGELNVQGTITGSLFGTATNAVSASYSQTAGTASYVLNSANGDALIADGGNATLTYNVGGTKWVSNQPLDVPTSGLLINNTAVTATATELNYLDGADSNITSLTLPASTTISTFGASLIDDADAATARTTIGLGNVTNESKATMFTSPTFTGTVSGVTATHVGLGTSANVQFNSLGIGTTAPGVAGVIRATNDIIAYYSSDERLKNNIIPIQGAINKIKNLGGYEFDWNDNQDIHTGHDIGVIAQEVEKVLPEIVTTRDNGYKAVRYEKIVALLIEAVKEQQLQIDELKSKL